MRELNFRRCNFQQLIPVFGSIVQRTSRFNSQIMFFFQYKFWMTVIQLAMMTYDELPKSDMNISQRMHNRIIAYRF